MEVTENQYKFKFYSVMISFFVAFFAIYFVYINVERSHNGNLWGALLPGQIFGTPEVDKYQGIYPINEGGWDGQFYYNISNDILGRTDVPDHIDSPSYRYQRIAVPLFTKILAEILGYKEYAPPFIFYGVQILFLFLGTYFLCNLFIHFNVNPLYSLLWSFSFVQLNTLLHGLTDFTSDALFIITFSMILRKKYIAYVIAASLLLLSREGYAVFAGIIFILGFLGKLEGIKKFSLNSFVLSIPGFVFVAWYVYVTVHFQATPSSQAKGMLSWTLFSWGQNLIASFKNHDEIEIYMHIITLVFLLFMTYIIVKSIRGFKQHSFNTILIAVLGYILLIWHLGEGVTNFFTNYVKAVTVFFSIAPLFFNHTSKKIKWTLVAIIIAIQLPSAVVIVKTKIIDARTWPAYVNEVFISKELPSGPLKTFKSTINISSVKEINFSKKHRFFGKNDQLLEVSIENLSNETWFNIGEKNTGKYITNIGYQWFDETGTNLIADGERTQLVKNVAPGEKIYQNMLIAKYNKSGRFILRISLVQEGVSWFHGVGGGFIDIPVHVLE